jgi:hypothetical protein
LTRFSGVAAAVIATLSISHSRQHTADGKQQTAESRQQTVERREERGERKQYLTLFSGVAAADRATIGMGDHGKWRDLSNSLIATVA